MRKYLDEHKKKKNRSKEQKTVLYEAWTLAKEN